MCDIKYDVVPLVIYRGCEQEEATSHMQLNWRRVKRIYFEVYLFRTAITANAEAAIRRTTARTTAALITAGRFKACRARLTDEEWFAVLGSGSGVFGGVEPVVVKYNNWLELTQAVIDSGYEYNSDMLEDPTIPHVLDGFDRIHIKVAMKSSQVRSALAEVCLRLGYEPYT